MEKCLAATARTTKPQTQVRFGDPPRGLLPASIIAAFRASQRSYKKHLYRRTACAWSVGLRTSLLYRLRACLVLRLGPQQLAVPPEHPRHRRHNQRTKCQDARRPPNTKRFVELQREKWKSGR